MQNNQSAHYQQVESSTFEHTSRIVSDETNRCYRRNEVGVVEIQLFRNRQNERVENDDGQPDKRVLERMHIHTVY